MASITNISLRVSWQCCCYTILSYAFLLKNTGSNSPHIGTVCISAKSLICDSNEILHGTNLWCAAPVSCHGTWSESTQLRELVIRQVVSRISILSSDVIRNNVPPEPPVALTYVTHSFARPAYGVPRERVTYGVRPLTSYCRTVTEYIITGYDSRVVTSDNVSVG